MRRSTAAGSSFDRYLREIATVPLLSREEEIELARRIREGDEGARHRLVSANLRFVVSVAKRYQYRGVPLADLVNEGNIGLLKAAERFDETRGVRFISYAVWWIRQAMSQAIARGSAPAAGRQPPPHLVSLETPLGNDRGARLQDVVPDLEKEPPDVTLDREVRRHLLDRGLLTLPSREQYVLRLYYGLDGDVPRTLGEIGAELGVTRERVRQIKDRALARLRIALRGSGAERHLR
ncbi:MAG: RNA polymerase sigma factor RpoD/SigA [Gemmatimonadota bacterium]|nr:RNA polymerase sigma factor RpoD/SigA [Gemmatimonadota bacterium]